MLAIHLATSPDGALAWVIYALLVFLLIIAVAGAIAGPKVLDGQAPGALHEAEAVPPEEHPNK